MSRTDRAKQFTPFDALKGFREAILEKEKIVIPKKELSEDLKEELDRTLSMIRIEDILTVTFYNGEQYEKVTGRISKISRTYRSLVINDIKIKFDDIYELQIEKY